MKEELDVMNPAHRDIIWQRLRYAEQEREVIRYRTSEGRDVLRADPDTKIDRPPMGVLYDRPDPKINRVIWRYDPEVKHKCEMLITVFLLAIRFLPW